MNITTLASLVNRLAMRQVKREIRILTILQWIPWTHHRDNLHTRREWLRLIQARDPWLGEGARKRLRGAA